MTRVLSTLNKGCRLADKRCLRSGGDNPISLAAFAACSVVDCIRHILVDSKGFSGDCTLVDGNDSMTDVRGALFILFLFELLAAGRSHILGR